MNYTQELINDPADLASLECDWQRLVSNGPNYTVFNSFEWTWCWIKHYWNQNYRLHVVVLRQQGSVVAILPLYLQTQNKTCHFLGSGEEEMEEVSSEYLDFIIDEACSGTTILDDLIVDIIRKLSHYQIIFSKCLATSHAATLLRQFGTAIYSPAGREYALHIKESFASSTAGFSAKQKQKASQVLKNFDRRDELMFVPFSTANYQSDWQSLTTLHQLDWQSRGLPGAISTTVFQRFHLFMHENFPGIRQSFCILMKDGEVLSVNHYYLYKDRYYFYLTGTNKNDEKSLSPGMLLHYLSIRHLSGSNSIYDFMMGKSIATYKNKFCKAGDHFYTITIFPRTLRGYCRYLKARLKRILSR